MGHIREEIKAFLKLMQEYAKYGAVDTEPRNEFYNLLEASFKGEDFPDDYESENWQLYSSVEGVEEVAEELTAKYRQLHHAIQEAPHKQIVEASNYFGIEY